MTTIEDFLGFIVNPPPGDPSLTAAGDQTRIQANTLIAPPANGIDDTQTWTNLINELNSVAGAEIKAPAGVYFISSPLPQITSPVDLHGTTAGIPSTLAGTVLKFAPGVPGLKLGANASLSHIHDLYCLSESTIAGTDNGITSLAHGVTYDRLVLDGFGQDGLNLDTTASGNANNSVIGVVRCVNNKRDGFHVFGANSNVIAWTGGADASSNGGWGYNLDVASCGMLAPHAAGNTLGAFQDAGSSTIYLMPYSEGGAGNNVTLSGNGITWMQGTYTSPTITNSGTNNNVLTSGAWNSILRGIDPATGDIWAFTFGSYGVGYLALANATHAVNIFDIDGSGTRFEMLVPLLLTGGINGTTGTAAPGAGGAGALPATPAGYLTVEINGTNRKIPYY